MDAETGAPKTRTTEVRVADGSRLCVEERGAPGDPAILLIGGATWSMDWWEDGFCEQLAGRGRRVVRYDQRDTGRSTSWPVGAPGYTAADLVADSLAVLDALDLQRAHVVGLSMGGGVAQRLALDHPERASTVTPMSTSPVEDADGDLPGPTPAIQATFTAEGPEPDWGDHEAVVDYIVEAERPYAGPDTFDAERVRAVAGIAVRRARDIAASLTNHFVLEDPGPATRRLADLRGLPTLVVHGTADPLFPIDHGEALARLIPGARLLPLDGVGHQLPPPGMWPLVVDALVEHTGAR